jgi:flagellar basal-body rod modification protein FlgD
MPTPTTPAPATGPFTVTTPTPAKAKPADDAFSQASFLNLLASQMKNQNPLEPLKDTEFLGQMAQFSSLEQLSAMNKATTALNQASQLGQGAALIGKQVTYQRDDGGTVTGTVERLTVDAKSGTTSLVVGGLPIDLAQVVGVNG